MLDTDLAQALGYAEPCMIHKLIKRGQDALPTLGTLCATVPQSIRGRPANECHLNKAQALFIISKAETTKAIAVTVAMIEKIVAYEAGALPPKPALPDFSNPVLAARAWADELEQKLLAQAEKKVLAA